MDENDKFVENLYAASSVHTSTIVSIDGETTKINNLDVGQTQIGSEETPLNRLYVSNISVVKHDVSFAKISPDSFQKNLQITGQVSNHGLFKSIHAQFEFNIIKLRATTIKPRTILASFPAEFAPPKPITFYTNLSPLYKSYFAAGTIGVSQLISVLIQPNGTIEMGDCYCQLDGLGSLGNILSFVAFQINTIY